jgi:hypothetical protein
MFANLRHPLVLLLLLCSFVAHQTQGETMNIQLEINGHRLQATLEDTPSGRDFYSLLPLTLTAEDYSHTETIAYLPRKLAIDKAPAGIDPQIGDITYYAPWGNLALFHHDFGYSKGLIRLGHIEGQLDAITSGIKLSESSTLTITAVTYGSGTERHTAEEIKK